MGMIDAKGRGSRPEWTALEKWARLRVQEFVQELLKAEVTELLGREKSERVAAVDGELGYRNGYGKPRRLTMSCGTITLRRPRVRGLEQRLESRVLPLFKRRTEKVSELLPELYRAGARVPRCPSAQSASKEGPSDANANCPSSAPAFRHLARILCLKLRRGREARRQLVAEAVTRHESLLHGRILRRHRPWGRLLDLEACQERSRSSRASRRVVPGVPRQVPFQW
jgi:hypothetical protein